MQTWNRERIRTRDRLIDQDYNVPPTTENTNQSYPYPQTGISAYLLQKQLLLLALENGFEGTTSEELWAQLLAKAPTKLAHVLKFGAGQEFVFDGSKDVTIPVYTGTII